MSFTDRAQFGCFVSAKGRFMHEPEGEVPFSPISFSPSSFPRTAFQRDRDRVIHSVAFRRLKHKTQVFLYHEGDYYRTRLTHSLEVAQIARTLARALGLNEDIAEAVALAHDLGHPPFGHAGESALNQVMSPYGGFDHNEQSLRVLTMLEQRYAHFDGLNLTFETIDGVLKHNGPIDKSKARETVLNLDRAWGLDLGLYPSAEAQIANLSDDIAYLAHDFDDALRAELITIKQMKDLPVMGKILQELHAQFGELEIGRLTHEMTRRLIGYFVLDAYTSSRAAIGDLHPVQVDDIRKADRSVICHSPAIAQEIEALRDFLMRYSWRHYKVNRMTHKSKKILIALFEVFMGETNLLPTVWQEKAKGSEASKARVIADYLASMTDRYALLEHKRIFETGPILEQK